LNSIENDFRRIFRIPKKLKIEINSEIKNSTEITLSARNKIISSYILHKNITQITDKDIIELKKATKDTILKKYPVLGKLFNIFGWWFIFTGSYTLLNVCPCCGQVGCPVGIGVISVYAGIMALLKTLFIVIVDKIKSLKSLIFSQSRKSHF